MVSNKTIARPYAKAIFAIALQYDNLVAWAEILQILSQLVQEQKINNFLCDPRIDWSAKAELFIDVCGNFLDEDAHNLVKVLAQNRRLILLPEISRLFDELKDKYNNFTEVDVVTVYELTAEQKKQLYEKLTKKLACKIHLNYIFDKNLIAGLIIKAKDRVIDGSISAYLAQLSKQLLT